ncbi:hypothetical protein KAT92_03850, partial [Candidatus Babeliales bacterium]|nr:hypothetical protein [Candidatus Babeliales bacterium]
MIIRNINLISVIGLLASFFLMNNLSGEEDLRGYFAEQSAPIHAIVKASKGKLDSIGKDKEIVVKVDVAVLINLVLNEQPAKNKDWLNQQDENLLTPLDIAENLGYTELADKLKTIEAKNTFLEFKLENEKETLSVPFRHIVANNLKYFLAAINGGFEESKSD